METVIRKGHRTETERTQKGHGSNTVGIWNKHERTSNNRKEQPQNDHGMDTEGTQGSHGTGTDLNLFVVVLMTSQKSLVSN